jgi:hypothetical protein
LSHNLSPQVVIIGAGPYGLSLAAHLNDRDVPCRIFGKPMQMWDERMPKGMVLKSDGFASNLTAGRASYTLADFCAENGYEYDATKIPVKVEYFIEYGKEFQRRLVPQLERHNVTDLRRVAGGFEVRLDNGEELVTPLVVVAVGISHFEFLPPVFEGMPEKYVTHAASHEDLSIFAGRNVTVLGAGASALEYAAILSEFGADVTVCARAKVARFHDGPKETRTLWDKISAPSTEIGPGWRSWMACKGPHVFRFLPENLRRKIVKKHLGPAGGYSIKNRVVGRCAMLLGVTVEYATVQNGKVHMSLAGEQCMMEHITDHVIAATGYEVDMSRLGFLSTGLREQVSSSRGAPLLDANFQSTVPGLYFVGLSSAPTFGPVMRFACGARYASTWLSRHLEKAARAKLHVARVHELQAVEQ